MNIVQIKGNSGNATVNNHEWLRTSIFLQLILGRRVQEGPGEKAGLQQASRLLLQGIRGLLEQVEGHLTEGLSQVHSRGRAEAALRRQQVSHGALCLYCSPVPLSNLKGGR